jgi:tRNA modification GTPase
MKRVVQLTPPGRGAIAVLLVEGPGALAAVAAECRDPSGAPLAVIAEPGPRLVRFGPEPAEEVVLLAQGEDRVELNCHGGTAVIDRILDRLAVRGCPAIAWRDWARIAQPDPIAAAALEALAAAPTFRAAAILLDQYRGALRRALLEVDAGFAAGRIDEARGKLQVLARRAGLGRHLVRPWCVVLAGPPNAGKSTLVNALLGYRRALVHPTPGTTRDLVTAVTAIDGWPVELVDTAGLADAEHPLERAGIAMAEQAIATADLVLLVLDPSRAVDATDQAILARWPNALVIRNKSDLPPAGPHPTGLEISALAGQGLDELLAAISRRLVPDVPEPGAAVPFTDGQIARIDAQIRNAEFGSGKLE